MEKLTTTEVVSDQLRAGRGATNAVGGAHERSNQPRWKKTWTAWKMEQDVLSPPLEVRFLLAFSLLMSVKFNSSVFDVTIFLSVRKTRPLLQRSRFPHQDGLQQ